MQHLVVASSRHSRASTWLGIRALLLLVVLGFSPFVSAQTSTFCPILNATVASGGTVSINAGACHVGFGLGVVLVPPTHGTATIGPFGVNQTINYAHNGNSATSDSFVVNDGEAPPNNRIQVNITITPPASAIVIAPSSLPTLTAGVPFSQTLTSTGGTPQYTYTPSGGPLPPGLTLSTAGVISGTPTQRGTYTFSVRSQDSTGAFAVRGYTGTVQTPTLSLVPASATAIQNVPFSLNLGVNGGVAPYNFLHEVVAGPLPPGISLSSSGVLSGTPTTLGTTNFQIRVTDSSTGPGVYFELENYSFTVGAPPNVRIGVNPASVVEDGTGTLQYTVTRSNNLSLPTTVNITPSGTASAGDYTGGVATVVIPAGATTATFTIDPTADTTVEPDETVTMTVAPGSAYTVGSPSSATATILNDDQTLPTLTLTKVSNGGVGAFTFTGTNGWTSQTITTTTAGVGVTGATQTLAAAATATTITETVPPGFVLAGVNCSGLGSGGTATRSGNAVILDAAATAAGSNIACTFTNTKLPTLTLIKVSNGGVGTFEFAGTNGLSLQSITTSTPGVGVSGATQTLAAATTVTFITENIPPAFALTAVSCTGLGSGSVTRSGNLVALDALATVPGANIVCTFTNTAVDPPTVTTPTATAVTANSATLGGNLTADGGGLISARGIVLSPTATNNNPLIGGPSVTNLTTSGTTGVFTLNATGLTPGTAYSFKAYATNGAGTGYTSVGSFTTCGATVVTNGNDSGAGSLRQTIADACPGSTITFQAGVSTVTLTSAELAINKDLAIDGGTSLVTVTRSTAVGTPNFRIFNVQAGNTVSMNALTVSNGNHPTQAGGIQNSGSLTLTHMHITGNRSPQSGGLQNDSVLNLSNSSVTNNVATSFAGGLGVAGAGTTTLANCTFTGNQAQSDSGAIGAGGTSLSITNCTVAGNTLINVGGLGAGITVNGVPTTLRNTIVVGNTEGGGSQRNIDGSLQAGSAFNVLGTGPAGGLTNGTNSNQVGVSTALLGGLAIYGGLTPTLPLLPGSVAINAGIGTSAPTTDQRGIARVGAVDVGAFESRGFTMALSSGSGQSAAISAPFANPLVVTVTSGFSEPVNGGVVTFTPPGSGASAIIAGSPATITGGTATTGVVTANGTTGGYTVSASVSGVATGVNFALTNNPAANLSITLADSPDPVLAGNDLTYTSTLTNNGPSAASNARWTVTLPGGLGFQSLNSPSGWSCSTPALGVAGPVVCDRSSQPVASSSFTLVARVSPATAGGTTLDLNGVVSSNTSDPDMGNNTASTTTTVAASPTVSVTPTTVNVSEAGPTSANFTVSLSTAPSSNVTVALTFPSAQVQVDTGSGFGASPQTVTLTPANAVGGVSVGVRAVDDAIDETNPHAATIVTANTVSSEPAFNGLAVADVSVSIADNDTAGVTLTQSGGTTDVTEGGAPDTYTLVLTSEPTAPVSITLTPNAQVTAATSPVVFNSSNWNVAQAVTVTAVDDAVVEGNHTGTIAHAVTSADPSYNNFTVAGVTANITDNDTPGVSIVESGGNTAVTEGGATDTYTVVLTSQPSAAVTITLTGTQVGTGAPPLVFTNGNWNTAQAVTVTATDDNVVEGTHNGSVAYAVTSSDPSYQGLTVAPTPVTITDNDSATVQFNPTSVSQSEASTPMAFTVTLSNPVASGVTVTVNSTAGTAGAADFTAISNGTVSFPANSTTAQTVNVSIANDALDENDEQFTLTLTNPVATGTVTLGAAATATGTIQDDDALPVLSVANVSQPEGNATNTLTFTVNLTPVSGRTVSFTRATADGTAVSSGPDADFVALGAAPISIAAGQTNVSIPVTINGDTVFEGDQNFSLNLTAVDFATPGTLSATATLVDDDQQPTTTEITSDEPDPSAVDAPYTVQVTVRGQSGSPTGTVSINDGTGASCGPVNLVAGTPPASSASCVITSTTPGTKTLTATYVPANTAFGASNDTEQHTVVVVAPTLAYAPATGSTVAFSGVTTIGTTGSGTIVATPSGGAGTGAAATTTINGCTLAGANPGSFAGAAAINLSFVGNSTTAQNLALSCTAQPTEQTATLSCNETRGSAAAVQRQWPLSCPAGALLPLTASPAIGATVTVTGTAAGATLTTPITLANPNPIAVSLSCTAPAFPFTATPLAFTIPANASAPVSVGIIPTSTGNYSGVLSCTIAGSTQVVSFSLAGVLAPATPIDAMSAWSRWLLMLLVMVGGLVLAQTRRQ